MFYILLIIFTIISCWYIKSIRFNIMSFFFEWFDKHETVGKFLGIRYGNDYELIFNRKETKMYTPFLSKIFIEWFVGTNINLDFHVYKTLLRMQFSISTNINLNKYFIILHNKRMNLEEFEEYLANILLFEINQQLNLLDENNFNKFKIHNKLIRHILNILTGDTHNIIYILLTNINNILNLRKLLLSLPIESRLLLVVPQFTILNKFVEMIISKKGNLQDLQFYEFVKPNSFLTIIYKNDLYIVRRYVDKSNSYSNIGFGVKGFQCPASKFVFKIIDDTIKNLKKFNIKIEGTPIYLKSIRYPKNIINKKDIFLNFESI